MVKVNPFPNNKFKASADHTFKDGTDELELFDTVENIVGEKKGENAGSKCIFVKVVKTRDCLEKG